MTLRTVRADLARPLTALTSLVLAAGLLAGCSDPADDADASATPTASSSSTSTGTADADDTAEDTSDADDMTDDDATDDDGAGDGDDAPELTYEGRTGATALELLLEADPSAEVSGEGENAFVTAVDGVAADPDSEFWALSVNGEMAMVGAGSLETQDGDEITWTLEEISS